MGGLSSNEWIVTIVGGALGTILAAFITYLLGKRSTPSLFVLYRKALRTITTQFALSKEEKHLLRIALASKEVVEAIKTEALGPMDESLKLRNEIARLASPANRLADKRWAEIVIERLLFEELKIEGQYANYYGRTHDRRPYFDRTQVDQKTPSPEPKKTIPSASALLSPARASLFFTKYEHLLRIAENCIGREQDIEKLTADFTNAQNRLVVIEGFGGIGKTTLAALLAVHAAHTYHVLWIECQNVMVTVERFLAEMGYFASEQYQVPWLQPIIENLSLSETEKISGLIEFLALPGQNQEATTQTNKPLALFFDDYHLVKDRDFSQLIWRLTESYVNIKVVLIARKLPKELRDRTTADNSLQVDGLSLDDCRGFITSYTKNFPVLKQVDQEMLPRIWKRTGHGVPTAMKIFTSMTRTRPLQDILQQLSDYDPFTTTANEWFSGLFAELTTDEQQVATEASIFRYPVTQSALKYISRIVHTDEIIDSLVDRFVLTFDGQQYSMHALWSAHIRRMLSSLDKKELHARAGMFYRDLTLEDRYAMVTSKVESCHHFVEAGSLNEAVEVILPIADTLRFWGIYQDLFDILYSVEELARRLAKPFDPRLRIQQSAALHALGKVEKAIAVLSELIEEVTGEVRIRALQELGWIYVETGDHRKAETLLKESLQLARQEGLPILQGEALYKLQYDAYHESRLAEALEYNAQRLQIFQEMKDDPEAQEIIAWIYHDIGNVYREQGRYNEALQFYLRSLDIWHEIGESAFRVGWLNYDIGQIYRDQGKYQEALQRFEYALQAFNKVRYIYGEAHVKTEIGRVSNRLDQTSRPIEMVKEAAAVLRQLKAPAGEAYSLNALAEIYLYRQQPEEALIYLQQSLDLNTPLNNIKDMAKSLHRMGLAHEQQGVAFAKAGQTEEANGLFQEALNKLAQAQELLKKIQATDNFERIQDDQARIQAEYSQD